MHQRRTLLVATLIFLPAKTTSAYPISVRSLQRFESCSNLPAALEVIPPNNAPKRTWFGNIATMCGQRTSRGNAYYQASQPSNPYWPDCVWLSATNTTTNVPAVVQIKIDMGAYTSDWKAESTADVCAGTIFSTNVKGPLTAAPHSIGSNNATSGLR